LGDYARMTRRILLVEPEVLLRRKLAEFLSAEGYVVEEVATARAALQSLETAPFDVVVSSLRLLGGMSGADVLDHAVCRNPAVVTILLGSVKDLRNMKTCRAVFIAKPVRLSELRLKIGLLSLHAGPVGGPPFATRAMIGNIRSQCATGLILTQRTRELSWRLQQSFARNVELRRRASELQDELRRLIETAKLNHSVLSSPSYDEGVRPKGEQPGAFARKSTPEN
jgi:DNA-binding response OmpR family regulator